MHKTYSANLPLSIVCVTGLINAIQVTLTVLLAQQVSLDREKMERSAAERQLADRVRELIDLQSRFDAQNAEANARYHS